MRRMGMKPGRAAAVGLLSAAAIVAAACGGGETTPAATNVTVFESARLITGDGGVPIDNAAFVVEDGRITRIGRTGGFVLPEGARRVNLAGQTVMPAIVDAHTHIARERDPMIDQLQREAYWGVAAVISMGQDNVPLALEVRGEVVPNGARLLTAGRGITMPEPGRTDIPYWVTSADEARAAVREQAANKVDLIKIWVDDRNGQYTKMPPEIYTAVIEEAHANGLRVAAHIFALEDAKGLLRAGVDAFAHSIRDTDVDEEVIALFKAHPDVVLIPNLPGRGVPEDLSWTAASVAPDELARMQEANAKLPPTAGDAFQIQARNLVALRDAGVKIAFGTDSSGGWNAHQEMADMVAAGMTPAEVLVAATKTAAEWLRLDDLGTLAEGKSADFLILAGNPLDDITNTRNISAVYLRGVEVDRAELRRGWAQQ
ncbi:MAG: amidohydrolase family protein [Vicinamibacterales bacterium]